MIPSSEGTGPLLLWEPSRAERAPSPRSIRARARGLPWDCRAGGEGRYPLALIPQERFGCLWGSPSPLRSPQPAAPSSEPGGPSAPRGRGTGSGRGGGGQSPHGWRRPPPAPPRSRAERRPVATAAARVCDLRVVRKAWGTFPGLCALEGADSRFSRGAANARPLPGPSPAGTAYLRALGAYGTALTLPGDAPAATAPPCCTAQGPAPARTRGLARAAPERRAAGPRGDRAGAA